MCQSLVQCIFTGLLLFGTGLTLVSWLTPGWRKFSYDLKSKESELSIPNLPSIGLLTYACDDKNVLLSTTGNAPPTMTQKQDAWKYCRQWYEKKPEWEKIVIGGFALAIGAQLAAILWSFFVCFWCCCEDCLIVPLPILTGISTLCLAGGLFTFWRHNDSSDIGDLPKSLDDLNIKSDFGYSVWIGVLACVVMLAATLCGIGYAKKANKK